MVQSSSHWSLSVKEAQDLITLPSATQAGFLEQARAKSEKAVPLIERARALARELEKGKELNQLLVPPLFRKELIAAAGFSQKASGYFSSTELEESVLNVFTRVYQACQEALEGQDEAAINAAFHEELVFRYLLTAGDALGGQMRNWTGASAEEKLIKAIYEALQSRKVNPQYEEQEPGTSSQQPALFAQEELALLEAAEPAEAVEKEKTRIIKWPGRLLLFNTKSTLICNGKSVPLNNIDLILLDTTSAQGQTEAQSHAIRNEVSEEEAKKGKKSREPGKDDSHVLS